MTDDKDCLEDSFVKSNSAAAMREALEHARCTLAHITPSGHDGDEDSGQCDEDCALCDVQSASDHLDAALATDAGAQMLERVRRAEAERDLALARAEEARAALSKYQEEEAKAWEQALCEKRAFRANVEAQVEGAEAALEATRKKLMDAWKALQESEKDRIATRVRLKWALEKSGLQLPNHLLQEKVPPEK